MGPLVIYFAYETSLEECGPCSNLHFCYSFVTVLNIHGQANPPVPWKHTWTTDGRFCCRPRSSAENVRQRRTDASMKVPDATKLDDSNEGGVGW